MNATERRERFRTVLAGNQCIYPAPVFEATSAWIAQDLGFEVGFMAGGVPEAAELCVPSDLVLLTLSELTQQVRRICRVSDISLIVVAQNGYGNALNVMRTVEELENAGASALDISDYAQPLGFGGVKGEDPLVSLEEGVGKMKAALAARQDPSLVIVARTGGLRNGGIPEAIRRIKAYEKAGVDAIFLSGGQTRQEVEAVHAETKLPLIIGHLDRPDLTGADKQLLAKIGVRIISPGHLTLWAAVKAEYEILRALRDGKSPDELKTTIYSKKLMAQVTHQSQYDERIKNFLN